MGTKKKGRRIPRRGTVLREGGRSGTRRDVLIAGATGAAGAGAGVAPSGGASDADDDENGARPLADLPMIRLRLPRAGLGREYVALQLTIDGEGPFEFMVDSGLTTELITPHLQRGLGLSTSSSGRVRGLGAGGATAAGELVELRGACLCCDAADKSSSPCRGEPLKLPVLHAVITDFPQEHIDPEHDPVEGMIGLELLDRFDVDFDFPAGRIRLWRAGTAAAAAKAAGMVEIPAVIINETGIIGIRLTVHKPGTNPQPVLGFIDTGSTFTAVNKLAASILGLGESKGTPAIMAVGIDGRLLQLPTTKAPLSFVGDPVRDPASGQLAGFQPPPDSWKAWDPVLVAVGDLPVFPSLLGDGVRPFTGPAALIGLDVLAQRRVILEAAMERSRQRRIFVSPK
jgi:predicted aspartyl protease